MKSQPEPNFARALRTARKARRQTQEDFDDVSSRVYISALERGIKQPTLSKVDALAGVLKVHPLTLLTLAYSRPEQCNAADIRRLLEQVAVELDALIVAIAAQP